MSGQIIDQIFAWTPLTVFILIVIVAYLMTRSKTAGSAGHGKTYACAQCGRRGKHEHMVPVSREGAVVWYCGRCAASH